MYKFKKEMKNKRKKTLVKMSTEIGVTSETLSRIMNNKQNTTKTTAFCITKSLNPNAEIKDYFEVV